MSVAKTELLPIIPRPMEAQRLPGLWARPRHLKIRVDEFLERACLDFLEPLLPLLCLGEHNHLPDAWQSAEEHAAGDLVPVDAATLWIRWGAWPSDKKAGSARSDVWEDGYELQIEPGGITLTASAASGVFYAAQTLAQLATLEGNHVPCVVITDAPRFVWRGFMLDSARHFQPVSWILRHLDRMAALKFNRFHWHLCDDQGWRAEIRGYPELTQRAAWRGRSAESAAGEAGTELEGGFYTREQMQAVVAYARARHIQVIPEIEMPAHCNAALVAYPQLSCSGQSLPVAESGWDAYTRLAGRRAFCAARPEVDAFLQDVLTEIAAIFPGPWLHLGGDETPATWWDACPHCQAQRQQAGLADAAAQRVAFLRRHMAHCADVLGRRTVTWTQGAGARVVPGAAELPTDQIVQAWNPHEAAALARQGHEVINSHHAWVYLDYPAFEHDRASRPDWMIVLSLEKIYHFDPLPDGLELACHDRILGAEAPLWTEFLPDAAALEKQLMPRLVAFSEAIWSPAWYRSFDEFSRRLAHHQACGSFAMADRAAASAGRLVRAESLAV